MCNGYHEFKRVDQAQAIQNGHISSDYLEQQRQVEITLLSEWSSGLLVGPHGAARWMITIVTKADLWWPKDESTNLVLDHYADGAYDKALNDASQLPKVICPYSSMNHLFIDQLPMSGFYTDIHRTQHHNFLVAQILEFASRP